jgi:hypothetical protein
MRRRLGGLVCTILASAGVTCGAGLHPQKPEAIDVHVLELVTPADGFVPTATIVEAKRLVPDPDGSPTKLELRVARTKLALSIRRAEDHKIYIRRVMSGFLDTETAATPTIDLTDPFRWGRRSRHGANVRGAVLCETVREGAPPFQARDVRSFMRRLTDVLFEAPPREEFHIVATFRHQQPWNHPPWLASLVLGSVPLEEYLESEQIKKIVSTADLDFDQVGERDWPLLRPLIVLGHRPALEARARIAADPKERSESAIALTPHVPRTIEDSVLVAYQSATDPELRGLTGWIATGIRSAEVYERLIEDVQAGRAVLPGDPSERAALEKHLYQLRAWQSTTTPTLTLVGAALLIGAAMFGLRAVVRRLI